MTIRTPELADLLVEGISNGVPLRQLCREHSVSKSTVYDWIEEDESLAGRIARARVRGYDQIAEEALEIADDSSSDYFDDGDGGRVLDREHVQRSKLRIETRLKLLAKWDPKRYGDRQVIAGDPDAPLIGKTDAEIDARLKELLGK